MTEPASAPQLDYPQDPNTAVGGWRALTVALARTGPQALTDSTRYRRATLRQLSLKRKVVR